MNIGAPFLGFQNLSLFEDGLTIVTLMDAIPNWLLKWGKTTADIKYKNDATEKVFGEEMRTITKCSWCGSQRERHFTLEQVISWHVHSSPAPVFQYNHKLSRS